MRIALFVSVIFWAVILTQCTGCAAIAGVKSYESGTGKNGESWSKWQFTQGFDFGVSANAVDTVENNRGIKPSDAKYVSAGQFPNGSNTSKGAARHEN